MSEDSDSLSSHLMSQENLSTVFNSNKRPNENDFDTGQTPKSKGFKSQQNVNEKKPQFERSAPARKPALFQNKAKKSKSKKKL
jgi:hypothetical protein